MKKLLAICVLALYVSVLNSSLIFAASIEDCRDTECIQKLIDEYTAKINNAQISKKTLANEINVAENRINLANVKIAAGEIRIKNISEQIASTSAKINLIDGSLDHTSAILVNRIINAYKSSRYDPLIYLLGSDTLNDLTSRYEFLRVLQNHDAKILFQMTVLKRNYNDQKILLSEKKQQLEEAKKQLEFDKKQILQLRIEKNNLLQITSADEQKFQRLLADARAELEAILKSQFTGKKEVKRGEIIGLMGNTGFSTGAHLHLGVYSLTEDKADDFVYGVNSSNPLNFLKSRNLMVDNGACYDKNGSSDMGNGTWDWPMNSPRVSQCYGKTPYSFVYANGLHDGLDMYDSSVLSVKAVDDGVAYFYRGATAFGNNVRIFHANGKMTLYLHLQ